MSHHETHDKIILLIHGLMRSPRSMRRLEIYLKNKGFETLTYNYPSTKFTISAHGEKLKMFIEKLLLKNTGKKLNFITHSLGGIIAREALNKLPPYSLNRCSSLIMLAPPNQGSLFAKLTLTIAPFLALWIKPLIELSSDPSAYVHQIAIPAPIKIGIIAGKFDIKVPPSVARLNRQNDFLVINSAHTFIMNHPKARIAIVKFLQQGSFA